MASFDPKFLPGEPVLVTDINELGIVDSIEYCPDGINPPMVIVRLTNACCWAKSDPRFVKSGLSVH